MKILIVPPGRNPGESDKGAQELPVVIVPDSSLSKDNKPVFLPQLDHNYGISPAFAIRIGKVGKHIEPQFTHRYCEAIAPAVWMLDISAIEQMNKQSYPWAWGCAFDGSVTIGAWTEFEFDKQTEDFAYYLSVGPRGKEPYAEGGMSFRRSAPLVADVLSLLSKRFTFKMGDIVIVGPGAPLPIDKDYHISAKNKNNILLDYNIK